MADLVKLEKMNKSYPGLGDGDSISVLSDIDLSVAEGETVAIVGPSGSGKSTLLNIIGGIDTPTSGNVCVAGENIHDFDEKQMAAFRNQAVGFIFQLHHLLPQCSLLENVLVPTLASGAMQRKDRSTLRGCAVQLIEKVGLGHRLDHRPGQLSGGERQRAAVARALINEPKLLLADEPTGALDKKSSEQLVDLLLSLNEEQGLTLIVVTHSREVAERMGRIVELDG